MKTFLSTVSAIPADVWIWFTVGIFVLLAVDLSLFKWLHHKSARRVALIESIAWISLALIFNLWFGLTYGRELGIEFLTGYLVEKSLSVDNLFIILLIFQSLKVPPPSQHRVLFYGILGAIILRAVFILVGARLLNQFEWILYIFGGILVVTAIKFLRDSESEVHLDKSWSVRFIETLIPISHRFEGDRFFIQDKGKRVATPLLVALIVIEATDVVFAVDSIPAVFAVTRDAFVAFSSNILAILGLRALYFVLADWVSRLRYLKPGLAVILGFIGVKMLLVDFFHIPSWVSLLIITGVLTTAALSSRYATKMPYNKNRSE